MKTQLILFVAVGLLAIGVVSIGGYVFKWYALPFMGALEEREITNQGAYRIQGYEQFYTWAEERDAVKSKLNLYLDRELDVREHTNCVGLISQYADITAEYNAASRAERTQGQWRADDLPETLENEMIGETCSAAN